MGRRQHLEVFGMSFLDMISCGLGGVLVLMLIMASMAETGGGSVAAMASSSEDPTLEADAFFHLGVICSGQIETDFALRVHDDDAKALKNHARRFEVRQQRAADRATLSVLQRGWSEGCLRIEMGNPAYADSLLTPLRRETETYANRSGAGRYDRDLGAQMLKVIGDLASSRNKGLWDQHVDALRSKLKGCSHQTAKAPVVQAFEAVAGAWNQRQAQIDAAPGCELLLTTSADVQSAVTLPLGLSQSCIAAVQGDYGLLPACTSACRGTS